MANTDESQFPASWYGLNYLGRPSQVSVQGESPTGGASSIAAIPAGGLGGGGTRPPAATPPSPGVPSSGLLKTASDVAVGGQGVQGLSDILTKSNKAPASGQTAQPETVTGGGVGAGAGSVDTAGQILTAGPKYSSPGFTMTGEPMAKFLEIDPGIAPSEIGTLSAAQGGTTGAEGATGAAGAEAGGASAWSAAGPALGAAALESLGVSMLPQPYKGGVEAAQIGLNPATALLFPDVIGRLFSGDFGSFFGGPPPAIPFPSSSWSQIQGEVGKHLPQPLSVPSNATPEQKKSIEDANTLIKQLSGYTGQMPSYLSGQQSVESWTNTLNTMLKDIKERFGKLKTAYPAAQQALSQGQAPKDQSRALSEGFFRGKDKEALQ